MATYHGNRACGPGIGTSVGLCFGQRSLGRGGIATAQGEGGGAGLAARQQATGTRLAGFAGGEAHAGLGGCGIIKEAGQGQAGGGARSRRETGLLG